jgi:hypothetical protein
MPLRPPEEIKKRVTGDIRKLNRRLLAVGRRVDREIRSHRFSRTPPGRILTSFYRSSTRLRPASVGSAPDSSSVPSDCCRFHRSLLPGRGARRTIESGANGSCARDQSVSPLPNSESRLARTLAGSTVPYQARAGLAVSSLRTMGTTWVPRISMARNIF